MARVLLVVPCFNEAERLRGEDFVRAALAGHELHFHFVDDGSSDATAERLAALAAREPSRVSFSRLPHNQGKGEAVRAGMLTGVGARPAFDYVGFWDADLATPLDELGAFVSTLEAQPHKDIVIGARVALLGRHIDRKLYRHAYGRVFATAVSQLLSVEVYDTQCGAKLFRVNDDLRAVLAGPFLSRWVFDVEILARYVARYDAQGLELGERVVELPLQVWTDIAGSKVGVRDAARAFLELRRIAVRYASVLDPRRSR